MLVDLPGYGYAAAAKSKVAAWTRLIHDYLHGRAALGRVYVLIDARHGLKTVDEAILDTLGEAAVSYEIVLTKCDQVSEAELEQMQRDGESAVCESGRRRFPDLIATVRAYGRRHPAAACGDRAVAGGASPVNALSLRRHAAKYTAPNCTS